jgi:hypothetical protein
MFNSIKESFKAFDNVKREKKEVNMQFIPIKN